MSISGRVFVVGAFQSLAAFALSESQADVVAMASLVDSVSAGWWLRGKAETGCGKN